MLAAARIHIIAWWELLWLKELPHLRWFPSQGAVHVQWLTDAGYKGLVLSLNWGYLWRAISAPYLPWGEVMTLIGDQSWNSLYTQFYFPHSLLWGSPEHCPIYLLWENLQVSTLNFLLKNIYYIKVTFGGTLHISNKNLWNISWGWWCLQLFKGLTTMFSTFCGWS